MLFLTTLVGIGDRVAGLEAGGDDYLVKPFAFAELLARVNALARRPPPADVRTALRLADRNSISSSTASAPRARSAFKPVAAGDEIDQLATNLNAMMDRLQDLMEGSRQVSNDIAHDLRTPLSRLRQRLEAARLEARSVEECERAVDQALQDADAALAPFSALLRIAQIEAGMRRGSFAELELSGLVEHLVMTYAPVAEEFGKCLISSIALASISFTVFAAGKSQKMEFLHPIAAV